MFSHKPAQYTMVFCHNTQKHNTVLWHYLPQLSLILCHSTPNTVRCSIPFRNQLTLLFCQCIPQCTSVLSYDTATGITSTYSLTMSSNQSQFSDFLPYMSVTRYSPSNKFCNNQCKTILALVLMRANPYFMVINWEQYLKGK